MPRLDFIFLCKIISCNVFTIFCSLGELILIFNEIFTLVSQVLLPLELCDDLSFIDIINHDLLELKAFSIYLQGLIILLKFRSDHRCLSLMVEYLLGEREPLLPCFMKEIMCLIVMRWSKYHYGSITFRNSAHRMMSATIFGYCTRPIF